MKKLIKQLLLGPIMFFKVRWSKYKLYFVLTFLLTPLLSIADYYFRGAFVGVVEYLGTLVPYFLFILIGYVFSRIAFSIFNNTYDVFQYRRPVIIFKTVHPLIVPLSMSLVTLMNVAVGLIPVSLVLLALEINPAILFESLILSYVFGFPVIFALGLLLAALGLVIRGRDFRAIATLINRGLWILFPTMFGINALPEFLQPVALKIPTIALVEGTRRLILGLGGSELLIYSFISGLVLLSVSYLLFRVALNHARKTGKILIT